jgi:hypothetical protein
VHALNCIVVSRSFCSFEIHVEPREIPLLPECCQRCPHRRGVGKEAAVHCNVVALPQPKLSSHAHLLQSQRCCHGKTYVQRTLKIISHAGSTQSSCSCAQQARWRGKGSQWHAGVGTPCTFSGPSAATQPGAMAPTSPTPPSCVGPMAGPHSMKMDDTTGRWDLTHPSMASGVGSATHHQDTCLPTLGVSALPAADGRAGATSTEMIINGDGSMVTPALVEPASSSGRALYTTAIEFESALSPRTLVLACACACLIKARSVASTSAL